MYVCVCVRARACACARVCACACVSAIDEIKSQTTKMGISHKKWTKQKILYGDFNFRYFFES